jgi:hypothetical protein
MPSITNANLGTFRLYFALSPLTSNARNYNTGHQAIVNHLHHSHHAHRLHHQRIAPILILCHSRPSTPRSRRTLSTTPLRLRRARPQRLRYTPPWTQSAKNAGRSIRCWSSSATRATRRTTSRSSQTRRSSATFCTMQARAAASFKRLQTSWTSAPRVTCGRVG